MSIEQNKAVVRRLLEAGLNLDAALVDELFAPDYVSGMAPGGREGSKQLLTMMKSAYPDFKIHNSIEFMVAEGDYVVVRSTTRLTNAGKEASGSDFAGFRFANGKIVEDWPGTGGMDLMQQVGVTFPSG